ncbi:unnamed protein product [Blepharisma stoltei]|uniref:ERCC1-like central domain-containing protein n=1 Tax=Blepharisma stoltei TaxID=1481888 RepID=A0AAU9K134_9CILI|nr:unnamed protein product [Blepharisma stoltei]
MIISNFLKDPIIATIHFPKTVRDIPTDIQFPSCSANFCRISTVQQNPEYLEAKLRNLRSFSQNQGVLLLVLDLEDLQCLEFINIKCFEYNCLLLVAATAMDLQKYIEGFASRPKPQPVYKDAGDFLKQIKGVNKSDIKKLLERWGTLSKISKQSEQDMLNVKGIGKEKAKKICNVLFSNLTRSNN